MPMSLTKYLFISIQFSTDTGKNSVSFLIGITMNLGNSVGEGNGTPLQYSCLETPMDGGAWWAAVRGVAGGWT